MNSISMSKILAAVVFFLTSSISSAQSTPAASTGSNVPGLTGDPEKSTALNIAAQRETACLQAIAEADKTRKKFLTACVNLGKVDPDAVATDKESPQSCSDKLKYCLAKGSEEEDLEAEDFDLSSIFPDMAASSKKSVNRCSDLSYTDYSSKLNELKKEKRDLEEKAGEIKEKVAEKEQDYMEKKNALQKEMTEAQQANEKRKYEAKEEERNLQAAKMTEENKIKEQLEQLQAKVDETIDAQEAAHAQRATQIDDYKLQLLECQSQAEQFHKKNNTGLTSRFGYAFAKENMNKKRTMTFYQTCVNKVLNTRKAQAVMFEKQIAKGNREIAVAQERIKRLQASLQQLASQASQAMLDRAEKNQKDELAFSTAQFQFTVQMQEQAQHMMKQSQIMNQRLQETAAAITQASNELGEHEKERPATKAGKSLIEEAKTAQNEMQGKDCMAACSMTGNTDLANKCAAASYEEVPTSMKLQKPAAPAPSPQGTQAK